MKREVRYIVIKIKDAKASLSRGRIRTLEDILGRVAAYRCNNGKPPLECVVVESDWPEYEPVWHMIEKRMDALDGKGEGKEDEK